MRRLMWLIVLVVLSGCAHSLPQPPQTRTFLPLIPSTPNKLGMAGCPATCAQFGCRWCYSWSSWPGAPAGVDSVPMIWDETHLYDPVGGSSAWLMGFNEPDLPGQAAMSMDQVVDGWLVIEMRFPDRKLLAPTWSHMNPWALVEWVDLFRQRVGRPPRLDGIGVHCYHYTADECIRYTQLHIDWAREWSRAWGKQLEVWVTEFYFRTESDGRAYAAWLDAEPAVTRWAPFVSYIPCGLAPDGDGWNCAEWGDPSVLRADLTTLSTMGAWYARAE